MLHYSNGTFSSARLPIRPEHLFLLGAAAAADGAAAFAVGRHVLAGSATTAVVLKYGA